VNWLELLLIPLGFAVGAYGTIVGAGGGFLLVPLLLIIYPDADPAEITSISLAAVFFNAISGSAAYARLRRIDYRSGLIFAAASLPSAVAGALIIDYVPRAGFDLVFGLILLAIGAYVLYATGRRQVMRTPQSGRWVHTRTLPSTEPGETFRWSYNVLYGVGLSAGIGLLSSLLGIGGGIFMVPSMITILRFPVHVATATSTFVLMFMSGEASIVHLGTGTLAGGNIWKAVLISVGVIPGAQAGAALAQRFRGPIIARLLSIALFVVAARLLLSGVLT
jgi:uncharacterized membrane protein YfcA